MASEVCASFEFLTLEQINVQHRRERKEVQAKIQALKKSAPKNDKKKRKEVMEEVARIENELEERHKSELKEVEARQSSSSTQSGSDTGNEEVNGSSNDLDSANQQQPRISKAQKRRDKKEREAREREEEIRATLDSVDVLQDPKVIELGQVLAKLAARQLTLHQVPSDGDCLYNAIRHQLNERCGKLLSVAELRAQTADYILDHKNSLICFMTNPNTGNLLNEDEFNEYCESVRNTATWGGQIELKALSSILRYPIEVIQAEGPSTVLGADEFPEHSNLIITYHRHMYQLGEHYNSTQKSNPENDSN